MVPTNHKKQAQNSALLVEQCIGVLDGRTSDEKLEVVQRDLGEGRLEVELRIVRWGEGVGWYVQRTLPIVSDITLLCALLRRAKRINQRLSSRAGTGADAKVTVLPRRKVD